MESRRRNSEVLDQQKRGGKEERKRGMDCGIEQISTRSLEKKVDFKLPSIKNFHRLFLFYPSLSMF